MSRYWTKVILRTTQSALKAAGLETRDKAITIVVAQAFIAWAIFGIAHNSEMLPRIVTAATPFLLFPVWFLIKLPSVPPALAIEAENENSASLVKLKAENASLEANYNQVVTELSESKRRLTSLPARDSMGIYQHGVKVGVSQGAVSPEISMSRIRFQSISFGNQFDLDAKFEFGEFILEAPDLPVRFGAPRIGGTCSMPITAKIVGRRAG